MACHFACSFPISGGEIDLRAILHCPAIDLVICLEESPLPLHVQSFPLQWFSLLITKADYVQKSAVTVTHFRRV